MRLIGPVALMVGYLFAATGLCQTVELKPGSEVIHTSEPKYEKPKSYNSTVTSTWNGTEYRIPVALVGVPAVGRTTGNRFQVGCLETLSGAVFIENADEMQVLFGKETTLIKGIDKRIEKKAANLPIAATVEPLEGKMLKATAGADGMHIYLVPSTGQMNLGDGLALDLETFGRKIVFKAGRLNIKGLQYTFAEGASIFATQGKLVAYGVSVSP